jgi:hypothetical protein
MESFMLKLGFVIGLVLVLIALGPLLTIWALNTLFPALAIAYTLETWAAVIILGGLFNARISKSS